MARFGLAAVALFCLTLLVATAPSAGAPTFEAVGEDIIVYTNGNIGDDQTLDWGVGHDCCEPADAADLCPRDARRG